MLLIKSNICLLLEKYLIYYYFDLFKSIQYTLILIDLQKKNIYSRTYNSKRKVLCKLSYVYLLSIYNILLEYLIFIFLTKFVNKV
jgi:hypothetical protein